VAAPIEIRTAHPADAEHICACLASAFEPFRLLYTPGAYQDTVLSSDAMRRRMLEMTVYAAVSSEHQVVGTIAAETQSSTGHLRGMAVPPAWHGRGIARLLLAKAEHSLIASGCTRVTLDTTAPLARAVRFYQKHGFAPSGKVCDFYGMPLYEYAKALN
jgi:GNAT superfamily N-acetyltransferase